MKFENICCEFADDTLERLIWEWISAGGSNDETFVREYLAENTFDEIISSMIKSWGEPTTEHDEWTRRRAEREIRLTLARTA